MAVLLFATPAAAATFTPITGVAPSGIARAADGTIWVLNEYQGSITQLAADGSKLKTLSVPGNAQLISIAAGSDGKYYVTSANGLFAFDPATPAGTQLSPTYITQPTTGLGHCGTATDAVAAAGSDLIAFTSVGDNSGDCGVLSLYRISTHAIVQNATLTGDSFGIAYAGGKVFTANFTSDDLERFGATTSTLTHEATISLPFEPVDVAVLGGSVYAPAYVGNAIAKVDASAPDGSSPSTLTPPSGTTIAAANAILAGADGNLYVTDSDENSVFHSGALVRVSPDGAHWSRYAFPDGGQAFDVIQGASADELFVSDRDARLMRFTNGKPSAATGAATASGPDTATAAATVDPRGADTTVTIDYGTSTSYDQTSAAQIASGVGARDLVFALSGLIPATTYHFRVTATNSEGSATGADGAFTTPPAPEALPVPPPGGGPQPPAASTAKVSYTVPRKFGFRRFTKLVVSGLHGSGSVALRCIGGHAKGCWFKTHVSTIKATKLDLTKFVKRHSLKPGAVLSLTITEPGVTTKTVVLRFRKGKPPKRS